MTTTKPIKVDHITLLSYVQRLGIKVYDKSQLDCQFGYFEKLGEGGSMAVFKGHLVNDTDTSAFKRIPVALKIPRNLITKNTREKIIFSVLNDVRQEIRMMKH